jgi:hypothetical protein
LGIIALESGTAATGINTFAIFDERYLAIAIVGTDVTSRNTADITEYLKVFAALDKLADYGDSARALIRKAMDYFG